MKKIALTALLTISSGFWAWNSSDADTSAQPTLEQISGQYAFGPDACEGRADVIIQPLLMNSISGVLKWDQLKFDSVEFLVLDNEQLTSALTYVAHSKDYSGKHLVSLFVSIPHATLKQHGIEVNEQNKPTLAYSSYLFDGFPELSELSSRSGHLKYDDAALLFACS